MTASTGTTPNSFLYSGEQFDSRVPQVSWFSRPGNDVRSGRSHVSALEVGYSYDAVGNRLQMTSTLSAIPGGSFSYDANDRLTTDNWDANGNTISSGGISYGYDFENRLLTPGAVLILYDGDGRWLSLTCLGVLNLEGVPPERLLLAWGFSLSFRAAFSREESWFPPTKPRFLVALSRWPLRLRSGLGLGWFPRAALG